MYFKKYRETLLENYSLVLINRIFEFIMMLR